MSSKSLGITGSRVSSFGKDQDRTSIKSREKPKLAKSSPAQAQEKFTRHAKPQKKPGKAPARNEAEAAFELVLEGNLSDLPPMPRSTVRIFLSSTFSDMRAERNTLAREAYPKLRDFCASIGLSFQVVDLRWGVTSEATNNHMTTKICLLELENCQKVSLGPSCIAILGNRYGFRPLPHMIPVEDYDILIGEAKSLAIPGLDTFNTWFKKDENSVPQAYFLQAVSSILPYFLDMSEANSSKHEGDVQAWADAESVMINIIHQAAVSARDKSIMTADKAQHYLASVTEHEVRNGILESVNPDLHSLVFHRELKGLGQPDTLSGDSSTARYKDLSLVEDGKHIVNKDAEKHLSALKEELTSSLKSNNVKAYTLTWCYGGVDPSNYESHAEYINKFCEEFIDGTTQMIKDAHHQKKTVINQRNFYSNYSEVLHHAHFCNIKCGSFCGQDETLGKIRDYILDPSNRKPFVVYANSGAGKTSVIAMAMKKLNEWIGESDSKKDAHGNHVGIIRFLGTSQYSSDAYRVLFGVVRQLADITGTILQPQSVKTMKALVNSAPRYIRSACLYLKRPVVVFLDSLDQLQDQFDARSCWWLPLVLPANFKLVLSTLPKEKNILDNLKALMSDSVSTNFVELPILPVSTCTAIVTKYLTDKQRTITEEQMKFILETFKKSPNPLYLKLLMDQAVTWPSYAPVSDLVLSATVREAISSLFEGLETKFGLEFVRGSLGLLTVGLSGLSEVEMEDGLSCLDSVMIETYRWHDPPIKGIVRVPQVMWARLRYDIREYIVERPSQGQITLFWYHRQFIEVATQRYVNASHKANLHATLFEMFAAEDGIKRNITLTHRRNMFIEDADRKTTPQPTEASNLRKLECLSHHIKYCQKKVDENFAKSATYCSLKFLLAKVSSSGIDKLIEECGEYVDLTSDPEVRVVHKYLNTHRKDTNDNLRCAFSIIAYIPSTPANPNLATLVASAKETLLNANRSLLIPASACLAPRTGEAVKVFDGLSHVFSNKNGIVLLASQWNAVTEQDITLACLDMSSLDMNRYICEQVISAPYISLEDNDVFYITADDNSLIHIDWETSKVVKTPLANLFPGGKVRQRKGVKSVCCLSGSTDSKKLVVSVGNHVSILDVANKKPEGQFEATGVAHISNLHCSLGTDLNKVVVTGRGAGNEEGVILLWDISKQKILATAKTSFDISNGASDITPGDVFHVCFGNSGDAGCIEILRLKQAERLDPVKIDKPLKRMLVSETSQEAVFQVSDSQLCILDFESGSWLRTLDLQNKIKAFDVAWEDEKFFVADEENRVSLYNGKFVKLIERKSELDTAIHLSAKENQVMMVTATGKVKIWEEKAFFGMDLSSLDGAKSKAMNGGGGDDESGKLEIGDLLDVTNFVVSDKKEIISLGRSKICRIWSVEDLSLMKEFNVDIIPTEMTLAINRNVLAFDEEEKKLIVFNIETCQTVCSTLPNDILCYTLTKDKSKAMLVVLEKTVPSIHIYDVKANSSSRKFAFNLPYEVVRMNMCLTPSERFAVFCVEITGADQAAIAKMWTREGKFPEQRHPCRFSAVDLNQQAHAGGVNPAHVFFRLSKVPQLGVTVAPFKGNTAMVTSRRWVMFWDIPTGNCDQLMDKSSRKTKMYRPNWLGQDCQGANQVLAMSPDKQYIAVGSQDGYVFVYGSESGQPVGMKAPSSRHPSPVNHICFDPFGSLVASTCTGGHLKLWEPKTGGCVFSASLGAEVTKMAFQIHGSGKKLSLVVLISAERGRLMVFDVQRYSG